MAKSYAFGLFRTLATRRARQRSSAWRLAPLGFETLEARSLLSSGPHGGVGTLFDEHAAVMQFVDFAAIHGVHPAGVQKVISRHRFESSGSARRRSLGGAR